MKIVKLLAIVLSLALLLCGCNPTDGEAVQSGDIIEIGEGAKVFDFSIIYEGVETRYSVKTDREFVGEALIDNGLIGGEIGEFGIYVKTVGDITLDYDTHGMYWAFYVNGSYAMSGVDTTPITEGESYSFRAEK